MPAKAPVDENVHFLYSCLIRSDYHYARSYPMQPTAPPTNTICKQIDFHLVAADFAINPAAARMRWSRLRKNIALNSGFKNDPNIALLSSQGKKKRKFETAAGVGGKKTKRIKKEGEDDEEVGGDGWRAKMEVKAEDEEGFGGGGVGGRIGAGGGGTGDQHKAVVPAGAHGSGLCVGGTSFGASAPDQDTTYPTSNHGAGDLKIGGDTDDLTMADLRLFPDEDAPMIRRARAPTTGPSTNPDSGTSMEQRSTSLGLVSTGPAPTADGSKGSRLAALSVPPYNKLSTSNIDIDITSPVAAADTDAATVARMPIPIPSIDIERNSLFSYDRAGDKGKDNIDSPTAAVAGTETPAPTDTDTEIIPSIASVTYELEVQERVLEDTAAGGSSQSVSHAGKDRSDTDMYADGEKQKEGVESGQQEKQDCNTDMVLGAGGGENETCRNDKEVSGGGCDCSTITESRNNLHTSGLEEDLDSDMELAIVKEVIYVPGDSGNISTEHEEEKNDNALEIAAVPAECEEETHNIAANVRDDDYFCSRLGSTGLLDVDEHDLEREDLTVVVAEYPTNPSVGLLTLHASSSLHDSVSVTEGEDNPVLLPRGAGKGGPVPLSGTAGNGASAIFAAKAKDGAPPSNGRLLRNKTGANTKVVAVQQPITIDTSDEEEEPEEETLEEIYEDEDSDGEYVE